MSDSEEQRTLPRTDRMLVAIAIACLLFVIAFWLSDDLFGFLLRMGKAHSQRPVIGEITSVDSDTRHRDSMELSWDQAFKHQDVRVGDGVFTGRGSHAKVILKHGANIDMAENTLIIFSENNGEEYPILDRGNFVLKLQGSLKVNLKGEVTEFTGQDSQVQVFVDSSNKPRMRLLGGTVSVKSKTQAFSLKPGKVASSVVPDVQAKPDPVLEVTAKAHPLQPINEYTYVDKLDDLYEKKSEIEYTEREQRSPVLIFPQLITWKNEGLPKIIYGQLANNREYTQPFLFQSIGSSFSLSSVFLGNNFWRVSTDGKKWEQAYFKVTNREASTPPPALRIEQHHFEMGGQSLSVSFPIESTSAYKGYLVETATAPIFIHGRTQIRWVNNEKLQAEFHRPGDFYFRIRGVNQQLEVTRFSDVQKVSVSHIASPEAPRLTRTNLHGYTGELLETRWAPSKRALNYLLEIYDEHGKIVHKNTLREPALRFRSKKAGRFKYNVTALDKFGRKSPASEAGDILVEDRVAAQPAAIQPPPQRQPAATPVLMSKMPPADDFPGYQNRLYSSSKFEIEGAGSTMYSRAQLQSSTAGEPFALMATLRGHLWGESDGAEASVKTKVANLNSDASVNSPTDIEARYMHRWKIPFNPFFSFRQMEFVSLLGFEDYRNTGGGLFSPGYDLFKLGFALAFPALHHWDTGGEVLYGFDGHGEKMYEVSGFMSYFVKVNWSLGVGYRVHLIEADNPAAAPAGANVPFREGYGEGYSVLRYHY